DLSVPGRRRVGVEHGERVRLLRLAVEGDHVSQLFGRGADRVRRTAVKSRVDAVTSGMIHWFSSSRFPWISDKLTTLRKARARITRRSPAHPHHGRLGKRCPVLSTVVCGVPDLEGAR